MTILFTHLRLFIAYLPLNAAEWMGLWKVIGGDWNDMKGEPKESEMFKNMSAFVFCNEQCTGQDTAVP